MGMQLTVKELRRIISEEVTRVRYGKLMNENKFDDDGMNLPGDHESLNDDDEGDDDYVSWETVGHLYPDALKAFSQVGVTVDYRAYVMDPSDEADAVEYKGRKVALAAHQIEEDENAFEWAPSVGRWEDLGFHS